MNNALAIGQNVFNSGDMANLPMTGTITALWSDKWGSWARIEYSAAQPSIIWQSQITRNPKSRFCLAA